MSKKTAKTPCTCSQYSVVEYNESKQDWETVATTGCPGTLTGREFAPGHDAKLKGFLIRAGLAGQEVCDRQGITMAAKDMASRWAFGHMVVAGIELGKEKRAEASDRKKARQSKAIDYRYVGGVAHDGNQARKAREAKSLAALVKAEEEKYEAEQPVRPEPEWDDEPQIVKAKVGRWEYEGTVEDGEFTYTDKNGEAKTTNKFKLV